MTSRAHTLLYCFVSLVPVPSLSAFKDMPDVEHWLQRRVLLEQTAKPGVLFQTEFSPDCSDPDKRTSETIKQFECQTPILFQNKGGDGGILPAETS